MSKPKDPPTEWAASIRNARKAGGLTQMSLAVLLGVASSTIYRIEQGKPVGDDVRSRIDKWLTRVAAAGKAA